MSSNRARQDRLRKVRILAEDDQLLVVDKPAGLAVHGGADTKGRDLLTVLGQAYDKAPPLHLAHRLDRGTSGVLLLAKSNALAATLQALWTSSTKRYLAVVHGVLTESQRIERPLEGRDGRRQSARSDVTPVRTVEAITLVYVDIKTGRHHQIRRHLASIGHPVVMDDKYGDFDANKAWGRAVRNAGAPRPKHLLLHAARLSIAHPVSGAPTAFEAPMPGAWTEWLNDQAEA